MEAIGGDLSISVALQSDSEHCGQKPPSPPRMTWQGTPMKSTNRHSGYRSCVIEQKPQGNSRSHLGSRGLELKRVVEVTPNSPYHKVSPRAHSAPRNFVGGCKSITVHASDFIKFRDNPSMLQSCKIEPTCAETAVPKGANSPEPWIHRDPWKNVENPELSRRHFDDAHLNQKWFPPSPKKESPEATISPQTSLQQHPVWQEAPEFSTLLRSSRPRSTSREFKRLGSRPLSACSTCDGSTSSNSDGVRTPRSARGSMLPPVDPSSNKRTSSCGPRRASPEGSLTSRKLPPHSSRSPRDQIDTSARSRDVSKESHREVDALPSSASSRGRPPRPASTASTAKPTHWR
jgi:hypothetical protein